MKKYDTDNNINRVAGIQDRQQKIYILANKRIEKMILFVNKQSQGKSKIHLLGNGILHLAAKWNMSPNNCKIKLL